MSEKTTYPASVVYDFAEVVYQRFMSLSRSQMIVNKMEILGVPDSKEADFQRMKQAAAKQTNENFQKSTANLLEGLVQIINNSELAKNGNI